MKDIGSTSMGFKKNRYKASGKFYSPNALNNNGKIYKLSYVASIDLFMRYGNTLSFIIWIVPLQLK